jgi:carbonic anhydrase/acetyltransferase-like protein (isoleucine patch superfamily)
MAANFPEQTHERATPLILPYQGVWPKIDPTAFIAPTAVVIGDVEIGAGCSVWFGSVLRGDVNHIRIGANTNIQDNCVVHVSKGTHPTYIGSDITIGHNAVLHGCTLKNHAFVGMSATVMDGVVVDEYGMVAAGALVTPGKHVESRTLWAGSPAKFRRDLSPEEMEFFPISADRYYELGQEYQDIIEDALS